jgi:small conductance mechanosensitive channel
VNAYRRVDCTAQLAHSVDIAEAIRKLQAALAAIPNVQREPAPDVAIIGFTERGPVLAVRPYTHTDSYWQVYFDTNRAIVDTFGLAGYPIPEDRVRVLGAETPMAHPANRLEILTEPRAAT